MASQPHAPAHQTAQPPAGLDYDFLRYIDVTTAGQQQIQRFYLPYFEGCTRVVDLGCGDGDFVALLLEAGIDAFGVDADDKVAAAAQNRQLPLLHQDIFAYLAEAPDTAVDGIFCAHLVEHLPYPQVMEVARQAARILRPGGRVVLTTPDCRTLFSHLEMFYLHFGHVSFYHPRLLCFMLQHEGFTQVEMGVNPETASPMLPQARAIAQRAASYSSEPGGRIPYQREVPLQGRSLLQRLSYAIKRRLAQWLVLPFTDSLARETHDGLAALDQDIRNLGQALQGLNGPFECFAAAVKSTTVKPADQTPTQEPVQPARPRPDAQSPDR